MEPFFLLCFDCHNAYVWHHRDGDPKCPNGCDPRFSTPWNFGFGSDKRPVPRHDSREYGDGDGWPEYDVIYPYVKNEAEMRELLEV